MKNKKIIAIVQARVGSTRLPGKVLKNIEGKPMLWHIVRRLMFSKKVNKTVIAIPNTRENDVLENFAKKNEIEYFRGSENDILSRYYEAAKKFKADVVIRITSDCPLIDPELVNSAIEKHLESGADYTANVFKRTFPKGLDIEIFNFNVLEKTYREAKDCSDREHVTLYIRRRPEMFHRLNFENGKDISYMRWTVDEKEDLDFVREIYKRLYQKEKIFLMKDILDVLEKEPRLLEINKNIKRKKIR